ncbi:MAG: hypothetical protein JWP91_4397 [Fibrobacteres bacterium]|nr:hypothetical protein [Fibrobacterota bacterium]
MNPWEEASNSAWKRASRPEADRFPSVNAYGRREHPRGRIIDSMQRGKPASSGEGPRPRDGPERGEPVYHLKPSLLKSSVFSLSNFFSFFLCRWALHQEISFLSCNAAASSAGHFPGFFFL